MRWTKSWTCRISRTFQIWISCSPWTSGLRRKKLVTLIWEAVNKTKLMWIIFKLIWMNLTKLTKWSEWWGRRWIWPRSSCTSTWTCPVINCYRHMRTSFMTPTNNCNKEGQWVMKECLYATIRGVAKILACKMSLLTLRLQITISMTVITLWTIRRKCKTMKLTMNIRKSYN